jgi:hypothetical protein
MPIEPYIDVSVTHELRTSVPAQPANRSSRDSTSLQTPSLLSTPTGRRIDAGGVGGDGAAGARRVAQAGGLVEAGEILFSPTGELKYRGAEG